MDWHNIKNSAKRIDMDEIRKMAREGRKIALIKEHRMVSGLGLKESKEAIETVEYRNALNEASYDPENVVELFSKYVDITPNPYTKTEFMNMIERIVDNMDIYGFNDMLEAVMFALDRIDKKGGLEKLAEERDKFINALD